MTNSGSGWFTFSLNGRDQRILVGVGIVSAGWQIVYLVGVQFEATTILGFLLPIVLVALLMTLTARSWFRAVGGRTC